MRRRMRHTISRTPKHLGGCAIACRDFRRLSLLRLKRTLPSTPTNCFHAERAMMDTTKSEPNAKPSNPRNGEHFPMVLGLMLLASLAAIATRLLAPKGLWPWNLTPIGAL